jgi:hypothetical protein
VVSFEEWLTVIGLAQLQVGFDSGQVNPSVHFYVVTMP